MAVSNQMPVVPDPSKFDRRSGTKIEQVIFNYRVVLLLLCVALTAGLGYLASRLDVNASFEKMIPQGHEFVQNYNDHRTALRGLGNSIRVVVANDNGDIYSDEYLGHLRDINDRIFLMQGVDRAFMKSLWMPSVRWLEITEQGFDGGPVMPASYNGSDESIRDLRRNIIRSGVVGSLVANDHRSSMLTVPLLDRDNEGRPLDYKRLSDDLETLRSEYAAQGISLHVTGFAKLAGDMIEGLMQVLLYFLAAAFIVTVIIFLYTRCIRSTLLVSICSLIAVTWQLGIMKLMGFVLDPFSILVPFLIYAIGVSHGAQKMNGIMQDVGRGTHKYVAARYTFRRLFMAGLTALLADAVGFAVLSVIDIPAIRDLAIQASIGVAVLIFTNLLLLPVLLSYTGVSSVAARRSLRATGDSGVIRFLVSLSTPRRSVIVLSLAGVLSVFGLIVAQNLQIGDLDKGAPELRPDSVYNLDNDFITSNYRLSSDQFAVIVSTPIDGIRSYETLIEIDRLEQRIAALPGVQTTSSVASLARPITSAGFEGNIKWTTINRDRTVVTDAVDNVYTANPELVNETRSVAPLIAFLADHKAETLRSVVEVVEEFAAEHNTETRQFLLAAGNAGIEAATNQTVARANYFMLLLVYIAVALLCWITFRSWRAVVVAIVPLMVTSILAEALMVGLGIGLKVATLPVVALGVGIGVDYALYLLTVYLAHMRNGESVADSYRGALLFTGKVVALIGVTLSAAVITWAGSPIKFQADMGLLLAFMFMWNMVGALTIIPALARFLLRPEAPAGANHPADTPASQQGAA